jgi:hypothetical protein
MPKKISQLESATDVTASDLIQIVDIEDTDMAVSGTNKKATAQLLANELGKISSIISTGSTESRKLVDRFADVINVKDFGAVGDGVADDYNAINAAVAQLNLVGGTLFFPPGHYKTTYVFGRWIEITKSGVSIIASKGSVIIENFLFYVHGSYSTPQLVGSAGFTMGDTQINTASAHGLAAGDYVQILSGYNAGSTDAGYFQMESQNPDKKYEGSLRLSEIHKIASIDSSTTASLYDTVIYPDYVDSTSGQSFRIQYVTISGGGSGFTAGESVNVTSSGGAGTTGVVTVSGGTVTGITLTAYGTGYVSGESVTITASDGTGTGASGAIYLVPGAQVMKLTMVENVSFKGLTFKNNTISSFREILARYAYNLLFEDCHFIAGTSAGTHFKCSSCLNVIFSRCTSYRDPQSVTGSSWNSFLIGGASQNITFTKCHFVGESQTVDFTPALLGGGDPGGINDIVYTDQLSVQNILVDGSIFDDCSNSVTTHPGCYNFTFVNNKSTGGTTGVLARSLRNNISNNIISAFSNGVVLSAFYHDSLVSNNNISDISGATIWIGVSVIPMSSETMNNNNIKSVAINGNNFSAMYATSAREGVQFRHDGNGVPIAGFTRFTDTIKTNLSDYLVTNNKFNGCRVDVNAYINGVEVSSNTFGNADNSIFNTYIVYAANSASGYVVNNRFLDTLAATAINISAVSSTLSYSYDKRHVVGRNSGKVGLTTNYNSASVINDKTVQRDYGVFTPTVTNVLNITSSIAYQGQFFMIDNVVTVSGRVDVTFTGSGQSSFEMTLPVPSVFTATQNAGGTFASRTAGSTMIGSINAISSASKVDCEVVAQASGAYEFYYNYTYRII